MSENLMCNGQKNANRKYRENFDQIFADRDLKEVAILEISLDVDGRINASEVEKKTE